jgi:ElaB/YqjD/DUF883 family membrane-anchored ribosome-binding protein
MKIQPNSSESENRNRSDSSKSSIIASTNGATSRVSREFQSFLADVEDLIKATTSLSGDDLDRAKAKLGERIELAKKTVEEMGGAISDQARSSAKATDTYVHEHPWQALGIGAAVSLLVGMVLARRK